MDASPEYIEMCKQAIEIQKSWKKKFGDYVYHFVDDLKEVGIIVSCVRNSPDVYIDGRVKYIYQTETLCWIPREDQLLDIIDWSPYGNRDSISYDLIYFAKERRETFDRQIVTNQPHTVDNVLRCRFFGKSWEQCWLQILMDQKYNKIWNEKKKVWE